MVIKFNDFRQYEKIKHFIYENNIKADFCISGLDLEVKQSIKNTFLYLVKDIKRRHSEGDEQTDWELFVINNIDKDKDLYEYLEEKISDAILLDSSTIEDTLNEEVSDVMYYCINELLEDCMEEN